MVRLTFEQAEELARRFRRSDALNNARPLLEYLPEEHLEHRDRCATVAAVAVADDAADEEAHRCRVELGLE